LPCINKILAFIFSASIIQKKLINNKIIRIINMKKIIIISILLLGNLFLSSIYANPQYLYAPLAADTGQYAGKMVLLQFNISKDPRLTQSPKAFYIASNDIDHNLDQITEGKNGLIYGSLASPDKNQYIYIFNPKQSKGFMTVVVPKYQRNTDKTPQTFGADGFYSFSAYAHQDKLYVIGVDHTIKVRRSYPYLPLTVLERYNLQSHLTSGNPLPTHIWVYNLPNIQKTGKMVSITSHKELNFIPPQQCHLTYADPDAMGFDQSGNIYVSFYDPNHLGDSSVAAGDCVGQYSENTLTPIAYYRDSFKSSQFSSNEENQQIFQLISFKNHLYATGGDPEGMTDLVELIPNSAAAHYIPLYKIYSSQPHSLAFDRHNNAYISYGWRGINFYSRSDQNGSIVPLSGKPTGSYYYDPDSPMGNTLNSILITH